MSFLDQIEPLKQSALAELRSAHDSPALEQARVSYLGANGRLTSLLKQLGSLSKEEKPAAGKLINTAKAEIENTYAERKAQLDLLASRPKEPADFTLPGRRRRTDSRQGQPVKGNDLGRGVQTARNPADLGTAGSHLVGNGDDGHGIHSFRYLAFNAAGAMAILLPPTSSRT